MMHLKVILFIPALIIATYEQNCSSPYSTLGHCTPLSECNLLRQQQIEHKTPSNKFKYRHKAQCNFPDVCCPYEASQDFKKVVKRSLNNKSNMTEYGECGIQYATNRIFDGTITDLHEFPWMALLIYQTEQGPGLACGGVLINHQYVLTAAHCVSGPAVKKIGNLIAVRLGEYNIETQQDCDDDEIDLDCALPHVDIFVESTIPHPNYTAEGAGRYHDIALIKLKQAVTYTKDVQAICLPKKSRTNEWVRPRSTLVICGWGQTETREAGSMIKLKANVPLVNEDSCKLTYAKKSISINQYQICAGGGTTDSCKGDSGGPLMFEDTSDPTEPRWYTVGVISFGAQPCATVGIPAVYTKITPYLDWIHSTIGS